MHSSQRRGLIALYPLCPPKFNSDNPAVSKSGEDVRKKTFACSPQRSARPSPNRLAQLRSLPVRQITRSGAWAIVRARLISRSEMATLAPDSFMKMGRICRLHELREILLLSGVLRVDLHRMVGQAPFGRSLLAVAILLGIGHPGEIARAAGPGRDAARISQQATKRCLAIMGAVARPGVFELSCAQPQLFDLVRHAGGMTREASEAVRVVRCSASGPQTLFLMHGLTYSL